MRHCLTLCWLLLAASLGGCLETIRRPPPDQTAPPWSAAPEHVRRDTLAAPTAARSATRAPAPAAGKKQRAASTRQVNKYALWCIEKGLWQEARLNLEQAVQADSQIASFHNNLGIVYEHLGLEEQAIAAYHRAQALLPEKDAYQANIRRFENRQRVAHPDSTTPPQADQQPPIGE